MATKQPKPEKFPWSQYAQTPRIDLPPRERIQVWLNISKAIHADPNIPNIDQAFEAEGNMHIHSLDLSPSTSPTAPACTRLVLGFTIPTSYVNVTSAMGGSHACSLMDRVSILLMCGAAKEGLWDQSAVSTNMSIFWRRPVFLGEEVTVEADIESFDKSTCVVTARICKKGHVCVTGQHSMKALNWGYAEHSGRRSKM